VPGLLSYIDTVLPPATAWATPTGYPDGLALCTIDSLQSIGVRYQHVESVIHRYRAFRRANGGNPETDGVAELIATFTETGGTSEWAEAIGNGQRAWSRRDAPLKASVVLDAATLLQTHAVPSTKALRSLTLDSRSTLESAWRQLPGQRSGISWRYLLMLAQVPGVKPDRMVRRFVTGALPQQAFTDDELAELVTLAAEQRHASPTALDHVIWRHQSGRRDKDR
jgi:hypothetical protein